VTDAPRAIVVGSGIGGAAAALLLAHAGLPVTLVEKNRRVGGSCAGYEKQGFHVDIGTHMFSRGAAGPLGDVLRRVGEASAVSFVRTPEIAEIRFPVRGGSAVAGRGRAGSDGVERLAVPSDAARMPRFLVELVRALDLPPIEIARAARLFTRMLAMSDAEVAALDDVTVEQFVAPFTDHPTCVNLFGFLLGLYFILPYWEVSAGEALYCFRRMVRDNALGYPMGGARAIPEAYVRLAEARGAEVRIGAGVRRVVVQGGRARGVELSDGTFLPATVVVSTSSVRTTVTKLVGAEHFPAAYVDRALSLKASYVAVQAKVGLSKRLVDAGAIVGGVGDGVDLLRMNGDDLRHMFDALAAGRVPPVVPFYCPVPTNFDPSLAPPGCQLLTACAVAPTTDVALADPAPLWEKAMLATLRRVVPGLDEHAIFVDTFSTAFLERWIGKEFGPAVSTGQTPGQVGKSRPPVFTPVRGLYLAGCGAGGRGVGTELAAASAMECVDRVLVDLGLPLAPRPDVRLRDTSLRLASRALAAPLAWATRA
jgi:prolycopene isomerase